MVTGNVGDSPSMLIYDDGSFQQLTETHHVSNPRENTRIQSLKLLNPIKIGYGDPSSSLSNIIPLEDLYSDPFPPLDEDEDEKTSKTFAWYGRHPDIIATNLRYEPAIYGLLPAKFSGYKCGISNTRGIGDFVALPYGFSHQAYTDTVWVRPDDKRRFIVCTFSDGIGDLIFLKKFAKDVVALVKEHGVIKAGSMILNNYQSIGVKKFGSKYDDGSICISVSDPSNKEK